MTINFSKKRQTTYIYNTQFKEEDMDNFCKTRMIPDGTITFDEVVEVVRTRNHDKYVLDRNGNSVYILYELSSYCTAYAKESKTLREIPIVRFWLTEDECE